MKKIALLTIPVLALGLTVTSVSAAQAARNKTVMSTSPFAKEYEYNSVLDIPMREVEGEMYDHVVVLPDGTTTTDDSILLSQSGTYEVHYSKIVEGRPYYEDYSFIVKNQYYEFSSSKSFASYENSARTYQNQGLFVSLAAGDYITFNKEIDLRSCTKNDMILEFFAAPETPGKMDFSELDIYLTDVDNPENYVKARFKATGDGQAYPYSYVDCGGNGQDMAGAEYRGDGSISKVHTNSQFGTSMIHSFYASYDSKYSAGIGKYSCKLGFDYADLSVYTNGGFNRVAKLDSSTFFSSLWEGFTSGKVKMSMTPIGNSASNATFVIKQAYSLDLSKKIYEDEEGPEITVNTGYDTLPTARIGYSYPVFDATAKDIVNGKREVTAKAYYVSGGNRYDVTIYTDANGERRFNTTRNGTYEIVYTAKDKIGNVSTKTLTVTTGTIKDISITPAGILQKEILEGNIYTLPAFKTSGGSGKLSGRYEVRFNGELIDIGEKSFTPKEIGVYNISYIATDATGYQKGYNYDLLSLYNSGAAFDEEPVLPRYFISGYTYDLPVLYATHYGQGKVQVLADVEITMKGGTTTIKSGGSFVPQVANNLDVVNIKYKVDNAVLEYDVECIKAFGDDGLMKIENYFVTDGAELIPNADGFTNKSLFRATQNGDASFEFGNSLLADVFKVQLKFKKGQSYYQSLKLVLSDKNNPEQKVTATLFSGDGGYLSCTVGNKTLKSDVIFDEDKSFTVGYSDNTINFNGSLLDIKTYDNGKAFKGFDSKFVDFGLTMVNAKYVAEENAASIYVEQIGNQTINTVKIDRKGPQIQIVDIYGGFLEVGETSQTARIIAGDVLDPSVSTTLTVRSPSGDVITSEEGIELENVSPSVRYTVKVTEYGQYALNYLAKDSGGNKAQFNYSIGVFDNEKPTITIDSDYTKEVAVGEYIIVPNYTVKDNYDQNPVSYVTITSPSGSVYYVPKDSNCMKAKVAGTYIIAIHAMDSEGNTNIVSLKVIAK